jgi:hypothetical protein
VISELLIFLSHRSSAFLRVIRLTDFVIAAAPHHITSARTAQKTPLATVLLLRAYMLWPVLIKGRLWSRYLATPVV